MPTRLGGALLVAALAALAGCQSGGGSMGLSSLNPFKSSAKAERPEPPSVAANRAGSSTSSLAGNSVRDKSYPGATASYDAPSAGRASSGATASSAGSSSIQPQRGPYDPNAFAAKSGVNNSSYPSAPPYNGSNATALGAASTPGSAFSGASPRSSLDAGARTADLRSAPSTSTRDPFSDRSSMPSYSGNPSSGMTGGGSTSGIGGSSPGIVGSSGSTPSSTRPGYGVPGSNYATGTPGYGTGTPSYGAGANSLSTPSPGSSYSAGVRSDLGSGSPTSLPAYGNPPASAPRYDSSLNSTNSAGINASALPGSSLGSSRYGTATTLPPGPPTTPSDRTYTPGVTGYNPGATGYSPGATGYNPPSVGSPAGPSSWGGAMSSSASSGSYRPAGTSDYSRSTASAPGTSPTGYPAGTGYPTAGPGGYPNSGASGLPSINGVESANRAGSAAQGSAYGAPMY